MFFRSVILVIQILVISVIAVYPQRNSIVGDLRFHKLESKVFGNTRTIRVLVPPGYNQSRNQSYPVLYLNDGQNLFQVSTAQFSNMEWGVDETYMDLLSAREVRPLIIVGIDNAGKQQRSNEYLPYEDKYLSPRLPNPQGVKYPDFLTKEVLPFIEKLYRVKKGVSNTGLGGSSYGALISLYSAIRKPGVFGLLLLESPSFYVSDSRILEESRNNLMLPKRVYLGVGTNEEARKDCKPDDLSHEAVQDVLRLKMILLGKNFLEENLNVVIEDCAVHNEAAYGRRFSEALRFLYGDGRFIGNS